MPDQLPTVVQAIIVAGAVAAAIGPIGVLPRRFARMTVSFWRRMKAAAVLVERELNPNGGESIKDSVTQIRDMLRAHTDEHGVLHERVSALERSDRR